MAGRVWDLPVYLPEDELDSRPGFKDVLMLLEQHMTKDGCSKALAAKVSAAEESLKQKKGSWLLAALVVHELKQAVEDHDIACIAMRANVRSSSSADLCNHVKEAMLAAEAAQCLPLHHDSCGGTVLGLNTDSLLVQVPPVKRAAFREQVGALVDQRLKQKCMRMLSFRAQPGAQGSGSGATAATTKQEEGGKLSLAACAQLSAVVAQEVAEAEECRSALNALRLKQQLQRRRLLRDLQNAIQSLEETVSLYVLEKQADRDETAIGWLMAKCEALCLKLRLVETQVLDETYTAESVRALQKVRSHLETEIASKELDLLQCNDKLRALESVGMGFDELVKEYVELCSRMERNRWAVSELKQSGQRTSNAASVAARPHDTGARDSGTNM